MLTRLSLAALIVAIAGFANAATIVNVEGRVLDGEGNPVAGARIAKWWFSEEGQPVQPERPMAVSETDGRFSLEVETNGDDVALMAIDSAGTLGGTAKVPAKGLGEPLKVRLDRLVETRVSYTSEDSQRQLGTTYVRWAVDGLDLVGGRTRRGRFSMKLPAGRYTVRGNESSHDEVSRQVTLEPGKPADLGEIKLPLTAMAKLFGKPAPAWHITDARGVSKEVQPKSFRGKWVVLEFWGYGCGACVARGLPGWMDFVDDHAADSDKFVVLAVHDPQATDFTMLDEKLGPIVRRTWRGRKLPFPILLDGSGQFVKDYAIQSWPTAVLLDPEGRVVEVPGRDMMLGSWACEEFLASKLTPLPVEKRLARVLDRGLSLYVDERPLDDVLGFFADMGGTAIHLDADELQRAGFDAKTEVLLKASGTLTLRAWLNLTLEPFGLTYVADGNGLRVVCSTADNVGLAQPSARQKEENSLVAQALQKKVTFDFQGDSLKQVIAILESKTEESFLIDPGCRRAGTINLDRVISGAAKQEPLSAALTRLLSPLGLTFVVRNEAVIITTAD